MRSLIAPRPTWSLCSTREQGGISPEASRHRVAGGSWLAGVLSRLLWWEGARPRLAWPDSARVALWVVPNIEFFSLETRPGGLAPGKIPDIPIWAMRDYGNRVGVPGLQRQAPAGHHVDRNCRLGDPDAELEQLTMHLGGAPQRVLKTHSLDQVAHLLGDARTASRRPGFPPPISGKTLAMPAQQRLGLDDGYGIKDAWAAPIEPDKQSLVDPMQAQLTTRGRCCRTFNWWRRTRISASSRRGGLKQSQSVRRNKRLIAIIRRSCSDSPLPGESNAWSFQKQQV